MALRFNQRNKMHVSLQDFGANVPDKDRYERGVDYLWHEFDLEFEEAFYLVKQLENNRSSVMIYAPSSVVNFYVFDGELNVQIDGDGFWHESNLDLEVAREILRVAWEGCEHFGSQIPGTNRKWDAYCIQ